MAFDVEMIKAHYDSLEGKLNVAKARLGRALTLTEKILYSHLHSDQALQDFESKS